MKAKKLDLNIIISITIFFIMSIASIYTAKNFMNIENITIKQIIYYIIGTILLFISYKNKDMIFKYAIIWYIGLNILLLFLLFFGLSVNGSKCWIFIGPFSIQPSEFMKIAIIIIDANIVNKYYCLKRCMANNLKVITQIMLVFIIPAILTFLEPDTGVVIIYFIISVCMILSYGLNKKWYIVIVGALLLISSIFIILYIVDKNMLVKFMGTNIFYRIERIINWSNQSGYQLENSLIVIATSGILGYGLNNIPLYFPEAGTDFIFTSLSSIAGFVGILFLILIMLIFDISIIKICQMKISIRDKAFLYGIIGMLLYQQVQNIGMTLGLLPITGITLPFISYGGSSLLSYMFVTGMLLGIIKSRKYSIN